MKQILIQFTRWWLKSGIRVSKRQQFVAITLFLTLGLILTQLVSPDFRYGSVSVLATLSYVLVVFVFREDFGGIEWLTIPVLPMLFTAAISLFYFLLPVRWLTRLPVAGLYVIGMYALLLTENIYHVARERSIALLRAAHSVGFLLTLVTYFLLLSTILSFRMSVVVNVIAVGIMSFVLSIQSLWSMELEKHVSRLALNLSVVLGLVAAELTWVFTFWPVRTVLITLFLTTCFYGTVGMAQQYLGEKLYKKTAIEFFSVTSIVLIIVLFATRWRGSF